MLNFSIIRPYLINWCCFLPIYRTRCPCSIGKIDTLSAIFFSRMSQGWKCIHFEHFRKMMHWLCHLCPIFTHKCCFRSLPADLVTFFLKHIFVKIMYKASIYNGLHKLTLSMICLTICFLIWLYAKISYQTTQKLTNTPKHLKKVQSICLDLVSM